MSFTLQPLPYDYTALEPVISARTMDFHHDKHHAAYVKKLNELTSGSSLEKADLESLIRSTAKQAKQRAIYNNAGQVWNHNFFWQSMAPNGGGSPPDPVKERVVSAFQSLENFTKRFVETAVAQFGSGWCWLVSRDGHLDIVATHDADSPLIMDCYALMTCDVWEHAYYLDYQNRRADFVKAVIEKLINWQFVAQRLQEADAIARDHQPKRAITS